MVQNCETTHYAVFSRIYFIKTKKVFHMKDYLFRTRKCDCQWEMNYESAADFNADFWKILNEYLRKETH
jgi:hypothetical protein